jgi:hypothetical protein
MKYSEKAFLWLRASAGLHSDLEKKNLEKQMCHKTTNKQIKVLKTFKDIENMRQIY